MQISPKDREIRQALINKIDELMPEAHSQDASVDVKIEYAVTKRGLETLITRLREEGYNV
tara:strand:+ start:287 stop:466 length:180 start_codon:yes stop_codon:yes gene_type:complete